MLCFKVNRAWHTLHSNGRSPANQTQVIKLADSVGCLAGWLGFNGAFTQKSQVDSLTSLSLSDSRPGSG